jgi:hypothetical protein
MTPAGGPLPDNVAELFDAGVVASAYVSGGACNDELYPLLVHVNLFAGRGYETGVLDILDQFR